ncbi:MAG TPA: PQQ-binding-like beta-propeller repeat protein [Bryobacteraceae bacterium]|nr:PQQ-binding-like beta-propeller repeat protein [Bryobacteraceae bacterium]
MSFKTLLPYLLISVSPLCAADWRSFGNDPQRTSWSPQETDINPANAGTMTLLWKTHLDNQPRELNSLTAAVAVEWVVTDQGMKEIVVVGGASDNLFALDAGTGKLLWKKTFTAEGKPHQQSFWLCPNALNATPLIRKEGLRASVYSISSDGKLHVLNVTNGEDRAVPIQFVPPFSKNWSLNLAGNILYTNVSQGCNGASSGVYGMDLSTHKINFFQSAKGGAGIWGRAGVAVSKGGMVFAGTGDGMYDAAKGSFPDTVLQLSAKDLNLVDYFTPANHNYLTRKDLDMGSLSPAIFSWKGREIVAAGGKEGVVYLLDAKQAGGGDHKTPLYRSPLFANEGADFAGKGFWGAFATAEDDKGNRWLFAPASGEAAGGVKFPMTNGEAPNGSIMAFRIEGNEDKPTVQPAWISRDMNLPEPPIVAGGLVFAISNGEFARQSKGDGALFSSAERAARHVGNTVLYAFDAATGKQLYSSGDTMPSWTHFSGISIASGRVYVTTFDSTVYAFGVKQ